MVGITPLYPFMIRVPVDLKRFNVMRYLFLLFCIALSTLSYAQKISGVVSDQQSVGLPGAYIMNLSKGNHAHTDMLGRFSLEGVTHQDTLSISYVGFETKELIIDDLEGSIRIKLAEAVVELSELTVTPDQRAVQTLAKIDLNTSPVTSSQQILRTVPGLTIGQHAGGGKAEQLFLRGFDIDHGTDFNISVDGMPVNMVSHAHGQGYSDLHFLIPELIQTVDFGKGPYATDQGNFTTAGYANIHTRSSLKSSSIQVEGGQFNSLRTVGLFNLMNTDEESAYFATAYNRTDGPFESDQNFSRLNLMGKYNKRIGDDLLSLQLSHFSSLWTASGQIPKRAVSSGLIDRFGAINDTEGGQTSRSDLKLDYVKTLDDRSFLKNELYFGQYDFELYSNFTFFLDDPEYGDQIRQKENRHIYMAGTEWNRTFDLGSIENHLRLGGRIRKDETKDSELSHTINRVVTADTLQWGDIDETNLSVYGQWDIDWGKWLISPGVRYDQFSFQYSDKIEGGQHFASEGIVSPKLNLFYNHSDRLQLYVKSGYGFHSNDTRAIVFDETDVLLSKALGYDIGFVLKPTRQSFLNLAFWSLQLEQELVYVGDAGIVEPSDRTNRLGVDLSFRYQLTRWLFFTQDVNYTQARVEEAEAGQDYVPLAPKKTATGGLGISQDNGIFGGIRYRHMADRPANDDNSIVAQGYTVVDMNLGYKVKNYTLGINIENLFNTEWNETQFATESRLQDEIEPVEEIHFTPGTPFALRASLKVTF